MREKAGRDAVGYSLNGPDLADLTDPLIDVSLIVGSEWNTLMKTTLFSVFLVAGLIAAGAGFAQSSGKGKVLRYSEIKLNGPMRKAYREFRKYVDAYGAIYVTETGGGGGRIGGQPSLDAAKQGALAHCREHNPDRKCVLYATKTP